MVGCARIFISFQFGSDEPQWLDLCTLVHRLLRFCM